MPTTLANWLPHLVPLDGNSPKFFGFSEFLASLALMVLAWTIAEVRYRFRITAAPLPLQITSYAVIGAVGVLTLLTDLWRAEQWPVPRGNLMTPSQWQAYLGGMFLLTFMSWAWFAFIRPPTFSRGNAERYARALYAVILKGAPSDLSVIADELKHSAKALIRSATDLEQLRHRSDTPDHFRTAMRKRPTATAYADDILLLIADKRFCRAIVESSPGTVLAMFLEMANTRKYGVDVKAFARNIASEALANKDSFLFHEAEGYDSGLLGYHKPISQAMFADYQMIEAIGSVLDPDFAARRRWDATQWEAYCRAVLITLRGYVEHGAWQHSYVIYRAKGYVEHAASDLYRLNGMTEGAWDNDVHNRLRVVVEFVVDAVAILESRPVPPHIRRRVRGHPVGTLYDHLAGMIVELFQAAAAVQTPVDLVWSVQHNALWGQFFNFDRLDGPAGRIIKFKVRRLIYADVAEMKRFPNFKGARIVRFCLNVMGLVVRAEDYDRDSKGLQKALLSWLKRHYAWLHVFNPRVAEACLPEGIAYEAAHHRLVKTYPVEGLRREAAFDYFYVDIWLSDDGTEVAPM